ncbi:MAG: sigma 54-interacting transcriptional regulator [Campylobacterota bacterium]|nr:sigma 54-interacting transcriptional regulator [Campylobacterota bacterium]
MNKFITSSESSKKILNIAQMSASLPVNVLIIGEIGVGKKLLAKQILENCPIYEAKTLEEAIINRTVDTNEYTNIIILNLDLVLNKKEFLENLQGVKIVATSKYLPSDIEMDFAIKIDILPLKERPEDLEELIKIYKNEAKDIYNKDIDDKKIEIDLSANGISLKKSIFRSIFLNSLSDEDLMKGLESFIYKKFDTQSDYKELIKYFEVPLLKAAKTKYKSQLQMANHLNLNRITLRKKLDLYMGEE